MVQHILCVDIGGTQSRFAHFILDGTLVSLCEQYTCETSQIHTTQDALEACACAGFAPDKAHMHVWGVAGLVEAQHLRAKATNALLQLDFSSLPWAKAANNFLLVNDFTLQAWASLSEDVPMLPIIEKKNAPRATRAVVGAGTGLGTAVLFPLPFTQQAWCVLPAEGGHTEMPFHAAEEDFANFARKRLQKSRISAEDVLSARGLSLIHAYTQGQELSPREAAALLWEDDGAESKQLQMYARFLGRFCRHWALNSLCVGGLYLGGGVLMKNYTLLQSTSFTQEFYTCSQSMRTLLESIPITLMLHENVGLWGAAYAAKMHLLSRG